MSSIISADALRTRPELRPSRSTTWSSWARASAARSSPTSSAEPATASSSSRPAPGDDITLAGYESYLTRFYAAACKDNKSPYPDNPNAPMPSSTDVRKLRRASRTRSGYLVQNGPLATDTTYTRVVGGTTMHWEGKTLRMLPEDFEMRTRFGQGRDWPLGYEDWRPTTRRRSASSASRPTSRTRRTWASTSSPDYVYPDAEDAAVLSRPDGRQGRRRDGRRARRRALCADRPQPPQARNGIPNPRYDGGKGYVAGRRGSTHQVEQGDRCQGNINCVPICPVQAKYNAGKTLAKALQTGRVDLLAQTVAPKSPSTRHRPGDATIEYKTYTDPASTRAHDGTVRGKRLRAGRQRDRERAADARVRAAQHERAGGRNLMDHAYLLTWALMPEVAGTMRGTRLHGGIADLRGGSFRRQQAAFTVDIHNDGWGWATGSPYTDLVDVVDRREQVRRRPAPPAGRPDLAPAAAGLHGRGAAGPQSNRVSVDPRHTDQLGNMRPVSPTISRTTRSTASPIRAQLSRQIFQRLGAEDYTTYDPHDYGYVTYEGEGYTSSAAATTGRHPHHGHRARRTPWSTARQRSWDHENLYLAGGGSMPSIGTSNITLTLAALCFRTRRAHPGNSRARYRDVGAS